MHLNPGFSFSRHHGIFFQTTQPFLRLGAQKKTLIFFLTTVRGLEKDRFLTFVGLPQKSLKPSFKFSRRLQCHEKSEICPNASSSAKIEIFRESLKILLVVRLLSGNTALFLLHSEILQENVFFFFFFFFSKFAQSANFRLCMHRTASLRVKIIESFFQNHNTTHCKVCKICNANFAAANFARSSQTLLLQSLQMFVFLPSICSI